MRKVVLAIAAAAVVATAVPASAQYYGGPSVTFGYGSGPSYGDGYGRPRYDDRPRYGYGQRYGAYQGYNRGSCVVTVRKQRWDGTVVIRRINRC